MSTTDRDILQDRVIEAHDRLRHLRASVEAKKARGEAPTLVDVREEEELLRLIAELDAAIGSSRWGDV
jgi:hypothetical protein